MDEMLLITMPPQVRIVIHSVNGNWSRKGLQYETKLLNCTLVRILLTHKIFSFYFITILSRICLFFTNNNHLLFDFFLMQKFNKKNIVGQKL